MYVGRIDLASFQFMQRILCLMLLLGISPLFGACALIPVAAPTDLTFLSVRKVPLDQVPARAREYFNSGLRPAGILEVSVASNSKNLIEYVREWGSPRITSAWCSQWEDRDALHNEAGLMKTEGVYWHNIDILYQYNSIDYQKLPSEWRTEHPFVYHIYIGTDWGPYYDLREHAEDVCLQPFSVGMLGEAGKTNSVVVPGEAIRAALTQ